jgi:hypothetical protein
MHTATTMLGTDDGIRVLGADEACHLGGRRISALARGAGAVWAVADGEELWRAGDDGGDGWERVASSGGLRMSCLDAAGGRLVAGTAEAHLLRLEGAELRRVESFDDVEGRDDWYTPWGGPPDVRSITTAADGTMFVNVHVGGIVRSSDGGGSWAPTIDIHADVHEVITCPGDPRHVLAATAHGLAESADAGRTWRYGTSGMHASYCRAVALAGDTVLVSCSTGPGDGRAALYARRMPADPHAPFERCRDGLPEWFAGNLDTACVRAAGATVAIATAGGDVYGSEDAGVTWERIAQGMPPVRCVLLATA